MCARCAICTIAWSENPFWQILNANSVIFFCLSLYSFHFILLNLYRSMQSVVCLFIKWITFMVSKIPNAKKIKLAYCSLTIFRTCIFFFGSLSLFWSLISFDGFFSLFISRRLIVFVRYIRFQLFPVYLLTQLTMKSMVIIQICNIIENRIRNSNITIPSK